MLFIVVPAYNEAKTIGSVLNGLIAIQDEVAQIDHKLTPISIVVVDDGSDDDTFSEAKSCGVIVLRHAVNRGQGAALQTGNEYALTHGADLVVHFDADGQFDPADVVTALGQMRKDGLDVVLGSRFLDRRSSIPMTKRMIILPVSRMVNFLFSGLWLTDVHNGFRIMTRNALLKIRITQDGMAHNSEIVCQINDKKLKLAEVPVKVVYNEYGQGIRGGMRILGDLIFRMFCEKG
ncbi:MAG: glycosyltransferase family 2 protein [bacterium]